MKDNKKNILSDLDKIISIYEQYMLELIENDPELHTKTIMINTILQRSVAIIDAYKRIIYSNNILVLNSLMRMQIDNCIFIYGIYLLSKENNSIAEIYKGIFIDKRRLYEYVINKRERLCDNYIVGKINKKIPKFKELYEFCCGFIHYSNTASLLTMETAENLEIDFYLSSDYKRFEKHTIVNGRSFVNVSMLIIKMLKELWISVDNGNALIIKK